ncbi:MAG: hypothetical protein LBI55_00765 [Oscillospiraceae bacterium]|nr:hypothetical protein [Oscillospiraceae bacterium]
MFKSAKIAFCGSMTALSVAIMLISGFFAAGFYSFPALSGVILSIVVLEIGLKWGLLSFFSTSFLSLLLVPNKESSVIFTMFFGYYPIIKVYIDGVKSKILKIFYKILVFNVASVLEFFISTKILIIPEESYNLFGISTPLFLLFIGNVVFWIYDRAVSNLIIAYLSKYSKKVKSLMHLSA